MATNYNVNYNDERFTEVEAQKNAALSDLEQTYADMVNKSDSYYQAQIDASQQWADRQAQLQQERTDFAIEKIEHQKEQAQKDYTKEQSGAYVDWQKQSNQYGANAEAMAAQGMAGTGYSESSQVSMYNTYQNRVATARESYQNAVLNYNNAITEARLQNNSVLAEIAYNALQTQLELSLQGFQYKNTLILDKTSKKLDVENMYYNRYQDVLNQINHENALAEQVRQYNESLAFDREKLAEDQRQFNEKLAFEKAKEAAKLQVYKFDDDGGVTNVLNEHNDNYVSIPGRGKLSWTQVYNYVKAGKIKETITSNGIQYTWVGDDDKNAAPSLMAYEKRQKAQLN